MTGARHRRSLAASASALAFGALRQAIAALCALSIAAAPVMAQAPDPAAAAPGLIIRVGQADDFSRVEFHWSSGAVMGARRDGQVLTLTFNKDAAPDLSTLHSVPLKWLKSVDVRHQKGEIVFALTLTDDADATTGEADGADFVNLFAKKDTPASAAGRSQQPSTSRPDPTPFGGVVTMKSTMTGPQLRFDFPWRNPCGAAVFRRGDAIWVVFDASAKIDLSSAPKDVVQYAGMQTFNGSGYTAVRIATRAPVAFTAVADGSDWGLMLEPLSQSLFSPLKLTRDDSAGPASLTTAMAGSTGVFWVADPVVGDKVAVVTAEGPAKGLPNPHAFVQFSLLQSAQGLAVESHVDDLSVAYNGDIVTLSRPKGLTLSADVARGDASQLGAPKAAALPGLIDDSWAQTGGAGYMARYDALVSPVADEEAAGPEGGSEAHMALARYLIGQQLSFEAIGVLSDAFRTHPALGSEAEFRVLRGMARAMAGRYQEAETDLAAPQLEDNPAASLWRGYVLAKSSQWADAKKAFAGGASALSQFPALWKSRFARAAAETALALGDTAGARSWVNYALQTVAAPEEDADARLIDAEVQQAQGDAAGALGKYQALEGSDMDWISGPATLHATEIQLTQASVTPDQAIGVYDSLRYRWRGGVFELATIRTLGQLYLSQGRYREALETFRSAGHDLPDLPEAVQLQADLAAAFKALFLDGQADGLQPVQALGLFYDFKELTPVGADGDAMVRNLARRLVDVDLLPQAEELLKYQVENRLDGVPKAQVASDLAVIDLMDRKPEDALDAINESRTTVLPQAVNAQRRIVTARALTGLGQYDTALEMLGTDNSPDATDARSEILWRQKAWPAAGAVYEKLLGDRYKTPGPLSAEQEGQLLRAAVAYSLAADDTSLGRLRTNWSSFVDGARNPEALRVALSGLNGGEVAPADFSRITADDQVFEGWVDKMKARFRQAPPPSPRQPLSARQANADAPPPSQAPAKGKA
ncbi:MAG TPA: endoglucanase [Caulobacteraceae bacterium]